MSNRQEIIQFLKAFRTSIIHAFETFEPTCRFQITPWIHRGGGGGEMGVLRGDVFEKGAVNWSAVEGNHLPLYAPNTPFFATGVSLITHMHNPHVPTVHMNMRYFETAETSWFGGGYDLTPMGIVYDEDTLHFHQIARQTLDAFDQNLYPEYAKAAQDYFFIPHRNKERGVGGIFFDRLCSNDVKADFRLWKAIAHSFLPAIMPIYQRRMALAFTLEQKERQLHDRAHYVEFNLLYDKGTKFGFLSNGNPEAILCSMPPVVKW
ncbi:MAG: oxygen-dependent coproporphyrinogen oxidase [Candidatus Rhabdochlamydia sp.]